MVTNGLMTSFENILNIPGFPPVASKHLSNKISQPLSRVTNFLSELISLTLCPVARARTVVGGSNVMWEGGVAGNFEVDKKNGGFKVSILTNSFNLDYFL